jgi:hypothetical protein
MIKTAEQLEELATIMHNHYFREFGTLDFPYGRAYEVMSNVLWERQDAFVRKHVDHLDGQSMKQLMAFLADMVEARTKNDARLACLQLKKEPSDDTNRDAKVANPARRAKIAA